MQAQTDMKSVIKVAETFLDRAYTYKPSDIHDIDHPFLGNSLAVVCNPDVIQELNSRNIQLVKLAGQHFIGILDNPEAWELYKKDRRILLQKSKNPFDIMYMVTKPYRFEFLKAILNLLSKEDFSKILADIWVYNEGTNHTSAFTQKELIELFSSCDPEYLMDEEELEVFRNFPDELTIYRGVAQRKKSNVRVFSWTLSKDKAEWFSRRPAGPLLPPRTNGVVYQANIKKEHVFAYFAREQEIIANPPKLYNITEL